MNRGVYLFLQLNRNHIFFSIPIHTENLIYQMHLLHLGQKLTFVIFIKKFIQSQICIQMETEEAMDLDIFYNYKCHILTKVEAGPVENAIKKENRQGSRNLGILAPDAPNRDDIRHNMQPKCMRNRGCQLQSFVVNRQQHRHT